MQIEAPARSETASAGVLLDIIAWVIGLPLFAAMVAYPQIAMMFLVRSISSPIARMTGALSSLFLAVWYAIWVAGADLTGSSTASLELIFYQIMVQGWAWLIAFAGVVAVAIYLAGTGE